MKHDGNDWIFSGGTLRYAHTDKLSISFGEGGQPAISYGYDGVFWDTHEKDDIYVTRKLTHADLEELAELQINQWEKFREWLASQKVEPLQEKNDGT